MAPNIHLIFSFFSLNFFLQDALSQSGITKDNLGELYKAFVDDLSYFNREYKNLDSDAVLGLRVAEGYLYRLLEDSARGQIKLKLNVQNNLVDLQNRVSEVLKKILPLVRENDPLFYPVLNSRWTYFKPYVYRGEYDDDDDEKQEIAGDIERFSRCVRAISGTKNSNTEVCTISDDCWGVMMTKGAPTAVLYYQVMFFILGEASGCLDKINSKMKSSGVKLSDHFQHICRSAYLSVAYFNFRGGGGPEDLISILRLSFSCGLYGYHEILEDRGLSNVIGWQLTSGCYGDYSRVGEAKESVTGAVKGSRELKSLYLGNGCISDVTGVGLGALAVYLRWVLDPPPQVQPVDLVIGAKEDARTVSAYMIGLVALTLVFFIALRRQILQMATTCYSILFRQRSEDG